MRSQSENGILSHLKSKSWQGLKIVSLNQFRFIFIQGLAHLEKRQNPSRLYGSLSIKLVNKILFGTYIGILGLNIDNKVQASSMNFTPKAMASGDHETMKLHIGYQKPSNVMHRSGLVLTAQYYICSLIATIINLIKYCKFYANKLLYTIQDSIDKVHHSQFEISQI